jgi:hypothetical protein
MSLKVCATLGCGIIVRRLDERLRNIAQTVGGNARPLDPVAPFTDLVGAKRCDGLSAEIAPNGKAE